jgi:hypothetical protein
MTPPRVKTPGIVIMAIAVVATATVMPAGVVHADMAFRKKKPAAAEEAPAEVAPSGGEAAAAQGGEAPAADGEAPPPPKTEYVPQADDNDPSLLEQNPADAAVAAKAKAKAEPPIYTKWQFWAIAGGGLVAVTAAIIGGFVIAHQVNGGDARACPTTFYNACYGQGR